MTIIEGVGDEVTHFFIFVVVLFIGIIAWRSTNIADRHLIRTTVLILERRTQLLNRNPTPVITSRTERNIDTGQNNCNNAANNDSENPPRIQEISTTDSNNTSEIEERPATSSAPEIVEENSNAGSSEAQNSASQDQELSNGACSVRQRRIEFFQSRQDSSTLSGVTKNQDSPDKGLSVDTSYVKIDNKEVRSNSEEQAEGFIRIRLKYLNDDQKLVQGNLQEQLGDFKKRHFSVELSAHKLVRLIFNGQVLQRDNETLQEYGLFDNCVVHCLIHQQGHLPGNVTDNQSTRESGNIISGNGNTHREWDLGNVLFALLSLALGVCWICRYQYPQLFTATTTVALISLTGFLTVYLVGMYMPDQDGIREG